MGTFNVVTAPLACARCGETSDMRVQFKFGECWQHEDYVVGDTLVWGGTRADRGRPDLCRVVVESCAERCPRCGHDGDEPVYVVVEQDRIVRVVPSTGEHVFDDPDERFLVLEE